MSPSTTTNCINFVNRCCTFQSCGLSSGIKIHGFKNTR